MNTIKILTTLSYALCTFICIVTPSYGQYSESFICSDSKVKSIELRTNVEAARPILVLDGLKNHLELHFDILENNPRDLRYSFVLADENWLPNTNLNSTQYLVGFNESTNINYDFSINTKVNYIHYSIRFPEETMYPFLSGNYLLQVKEDDKLLFQYPLFVSEQTVPINASIGLSNAIDKRKSHHQIQFSISLGNAFPASATQEISATVLQNFSKYTAIESVKPDNFNNTQLNFGFYGSINIPALNEYRAFDNVDLYNRSIRIASQDNKGDTVRLNLYTDENLQRNDYLTLRDLNGAFVISNRQGISPDTDADYCVVRFTYDSPFLAQQAVILDGKVFDFDQYALQYLPSEKLYYRDVLLKQGFYNYRYASVEGNDSNVMRHEGSYLQSENEYTIIIYRKAFGKQYQQILGIFSLNSANKF